MLFYVTVEFSKDFVTVSGNRITVGVRSRPEGGAANLELIKKIARHLGVSSAHVTIRSGGKSRQKVVEVLEP